MLHNLSLYCHCESEQNVRCSIDGCLYAKIAHVYLLLGNNVDVSSELLLLGGKSEYDAWFPCRNYSLFNFITCLVVFANFHLEQVFCHF